MALGSSGTPASRKNLLVYQEQHDAADTHSLGGALGTPTQINAVGAAEALGNSIIPAREDHVHGLGNYFDPPIPAGFFIGPHLGTRETALLITRTGSWLRVSSASQAIDRILIEVVTAGGDAASVVTVGLYRVRASGSLTVDRVAVSNAMDTTSTGVKTSSAIVATLYRGLYIAVCEATGQSATSPTLRHTLGASYPDGPYSADATEISDPRGGIHASALANAGALPASFALVVPTTKSNGPVVYLRTA